MQEEGNAKLLKKIMHEALNWKTLAVLAQAELLHAEQTPQNLVQLIATR